VSDQAPGNARHGRIALGIAYRGTAYQGWQSQPGGRTVQDVLEAALSRFAAVDRIVTVCAGRTDAGVHAVQQVVHVDAPVERDAFSWVRGTNRFLPHDVAVQWCVAVAADFHARASARGRAYSYVVLESPVRPSLESGLVGWVFRPLDGDAMREAASMLVGTHDFSSFRAAECQAASPVKDLRRLDIRKAGRYWHFDFEASAFLHHMVRNIMGTLLAIGQGRHAAAWMRQVLDARSRDAAAPTFAADGLYFLGPSYDARHAIPERPADAQGWMPRDSG
jgi:tRNA pseudouridine38-40 synthase